LLEAAAVLQISFIAILPIAQQANLAILSGFADIIGGAIPLIIGILIIVLIVGAAIILLPAIIVGVVVWFLTGSFFFAGLAFLVVAVLSLATLL
jgi:hypothetical protein